MWRLMQPELARHFRTVSFDLVGSGNSDLAAYDARKYAPLHGYASDAAEIVREFGHGPAVFVGHSVSAMIGALAVAEPSGIFWRWWRSHWCMASATGFDRCLRASSLA